VYGIPLEMIVKYQLPFLALMLVCLLLCISTNADAQRNDRIETIGDDLCIYILPAATAGLILYNSDWKGMLAGAESAALTGGVTTGLKFAVNEKRPNGGSHSFPSGHASYSFAMAEFIGKRYGWGYGIPAYVAASFVGYSRVESKDHYTHDVVAGAFIGILSSYIFTKPYEGWHVQAGADGKYYGIMLSRSF
jgi:membrane-associated phospholipid phosphatase